MTPRQFEKAIATVGLSQRRSAKFFGVDERTVRRWITKELKIPRPVRFLLQLMLQHGRTAEDVLRDYG